MTIQHVLADLHNTRMLLESEQQRRQTAEVEGAEWRANFESCNRARQLAEAEVARLRAERRSLWKFVQPAEGVPVVYVGVHAARWYEAAGEYEPTAGFVQVDGEMEAE